MKTFREFLLETTMTPNEAKKVLGLSSDWKWNETELKSFYRKASIKNHPDKGGNVEMMQKVNAAYAVLKQKPSNLIGDWTSDRKEERQKRDEKIKTVREFIINDLEARVDENKFVSYFKSVFNEDFTMTKKINSDSHGIGVSLSFEIINAMKDKLFSFTIYSSIAEFMSSTISLGSNETPNMDSLVYSVSIQGFNFSNNRKTKLSENPWKKTNKASKFANPDIIFPKNKITKDVTRKFSKRDAFAAIQALSAKIFDNDFYLELKDGKYVGFMRSVFMKQPVWMTLGIYEKTKVIYKKDARVLKTVSFKEDENFISLLRDLVKLTSEQVIEKLKK